MGHSPPILRPIRLLLHRRGRFISNSLGSPNDSCYHPQSRNDGHSWESTLSFRSWIVSPVYPFVFAEVWKYLTFSEGEALQVLADLHSRGDKSNELVVLEYEGIRQQVRLPRFSVVTQCILFRLSGRFILSALRARNRIWTYWSLETLVVSCSECACKCGPNFAVWTWWCTSSW